MPSPSYRQLTPGDPAPTFTQRASNNPAYRFDMAAGRYVVMCFFLSAAKPSSRAMLEFLKQHRRLFDDERLSFFGVSIDREDETLRRVRQAMPGIRYFWDFDLAISRLFGAVPDDATAAGTVETRRFWMILDPTLRVRHVVPFDNGNEVAIVSRLLDELPPLDSVVGFPIMAPVLVIPNVLEPPLCRQLIDLYDAHGGKKSGFMRDVDGKTVRLDDERRKSRADYRITDGALKKLLRDRVRTRVSPEIKKIHQFTVTRMERYIVGCYEAEEGGHFAAHRDNSTSGTAHRRFALSVNLNDAFDGGEISFPEYGRRSFKAPPGCGIVFSCSLMHAVSRVTAGRRYAFLPFLYDEAAAEQREAANEDLGDGVGEYHR